MSSKRRSMRITVVVPTYNEAGNLPVLVAQDVLEEHLHRERQAREVLVGGLREGLEGEDLERLGAHFERRARLERVQRGGHGPILQLLGKGSDPDA